MSDEFDDLLIHTCNILSNEDDTKDAYGQKTRRVSSWPVVATNVPCRLSTDSLGRPKEFKAEKKFSLNYRRVFMRSPTLTNGETLNPHDALLLNGIFYDIFEVLPQHDATGLHHLELICEEIKA